MSPKLAESGYRFTVFIRESLRKLTFWLPKRRRHLKKRYLVKKLRLDCSRKLINSTYKMQLKLANRLADSSQLVGLAA